MQLVDYNNPLCQALPQFKFIIYTLIRKKRIMTKSFHHCHKAKNIKYIDFIDSIKFNQEMKNYLILNHISVPYALEHETMALELG